MHHPPPCGDRRRFAAVCRHLRLCGLILGSMIIQALIMLGLCALMCSPRGRPPRPASKSAPERACTTVIIGTCGSPSSEEDMFSGLGCAQRVCTFVSHRY
jgi:hypothetical protein